MIRTALTIAIPTYNRAASLRLLLIDLMSQPEIEKVQILVSDNGSTDNTRQVIKSFENRLLLKTVGFIENNGFDANYVNCIKEADGKYIWIMGDDDNLTANAVARIMNVLNVDPDAILCNGGDIKNGKMSPRLKQPPLIDSKLGLFRSAGWHLTWIGTTVLRRDRIDLTAIRPQDLNAFVHVPIIWRALSMRPQLVYIDEVILHTTVNNSDYFKSPISLVRTFGKQLYESLYFLDNESDGEAVKLSVVRGFNRHLSMFNLRMVFGAIKKQQLTFDEFKRNFLYFRRVNPNAFGLAAAFLLPRGVVSLLAKAFKAVLKY